jgi:hypothetical protein
MLTMGKMMYLINDKAFKKEILKQAHKSRFIVHPGSTKIYKDLKELYWWPNMKKRDRKVYGSVWDVSTSKGGALKACKAFKIPYDTRVKVERYYYELYIWITQRKERQ